jgi:periplasmic protein TonB
MTAAALTWFEDEEPRDLVRWSVAAAAVVVIHAALICGYLYWLQQQPDDELGDEATAIAIQLTVPETAQQEQAKVDEPPPPQETTTDVTLPEEKPPEKVAPTTPAERTIDKVEATSPHIDPLWRTLIFKQLQKFKSYPSGARARNEQGVVMLAFTVDRDGHVLSEQITQGSGYPDLDAEVLTMVKRAQPLPAFPSSMTQAQQDFLVPIRFSLH